MTSDREAARRAYARAVAATGKSLRLVAREGDVDFKTLRSFLDGDRWPIDRSLARLSMAVGWPADQLRAIGSGEIDAPRDEGAEADDPIRSASDEELLAEIARRFAAAGNGEDGLPGSSAGGAPNTVGLAERRRQRVVEQGQPQQVAAYADPDRRRVIDDLVDGGLGPLDDEDELQDPGSDEPA